jgi:adenylate cyclase
MTTRRDWLRLFGLYLGLFLVATFIFSVPFFKNINNLLVDKLQGQINPRPEIVLVAIDDRSLQSIGAWEWNRDIFARSLANISNSNPVVVGIDVLFLEGREGDEELKNFLDNTKTKIVFSSKLVDGDVLKPINSFISADHGYVNFDPDEDGIIRKTTAFAQINDTCELSFTLSILKNYFRLSDNSNLCQDTINIRKNSYKTLDNNELIFSYSKEKFTRISFVDVYNGEFDPEFFKDKIVLIGSTALDLRSNLNDNFTSVFGETIPGVEIHANVVNSYLENAFLYPINELNILLIIFAIGCILLFLFKKIKNSIIDFSIFLITLIVLNISGFVLFEFGNIFPFVLVNLLVITTYVYSIVFKYYTQNIESNFVKKAFGQYINPQLLGQMLETPGLLKLGGETKKMTVLFSDIRGFTTISEGLTPATLINMLNDYLEFMSDIIIKKKGTIDKYIGDAIMAIWNAPIDDNEHENNAVNAALNMVDSVDEFNKIHKDNYPEINIGIGLNTGDMVVGNVGGEKRFDYTVLGDNVNLGARLEGLTKKYGVVLIVTEQTKEGTSDETVIFRMIDEVKVKGKTSAVKIFQPLRNNEENINLKDDFEKGFDLYQKGEFEKAIKLLESLKDKDPVSRMIIDRVKNLTDEQKGSWKGVWVWDEK